MHTSAAVVAALFAAAPQATGLRGLPAHLAVPHAAPSDRDRLPLVVVDRDNVRIDRSSRILVPDGVVIEDADGDGVIHIVADGVTLEWEGGELLGAGESVAPEQQSGVGIRILGRSGVVIRGARVHRFKHAIWATGADGLTIESCDVSDGWAMRLGSTPVAEDSSDWLWPHRNDNNEWAGRYGAAIWVENATGVSISGVFARRVQNGIVLEDVTGSRIFDNDCSFLSGWGLAMWRSSDNIVSRNAFDFCIRGYSHGVYNRGQDSAGILLFEQCERNLFLANSATHGGDGVFGFAGREALGEEPPPSRDPHGNPWTYARKGCNDNIFIGNDLSYAAAHGLELTFSFGNSIVANRFVENAICGIWGGYSQESTIALNEFVGNGAAGYGLERGGVNIEHSERNAILQNTFRGNAAGVHIWHDADPGLMSGPWAAANHSRTRDNIIVGNTFEGDTVGIHLRAVEHTLAGFNTFEGVATPVLADEPNDDGGSSRPVDFDGPRPVLDEQMVERLLSGALGVKRPVGARDHLRGRHNIVLGQYFPWDHETPMIRRGADVPGSHVYELFGVPDPGALSAAVDAGSVRIEPAPSDPNTPTRRPDHLRIIVESEPDSDATAYTLRLGGPVEHESRGVITRADWHVRWFVSTADPREDLEAWRRGAESAVSARLPELRLRYGHGGPAGLRIPGLRLEGAAPGSDHFGMIATALIRLPAGRWRVTTLSDDGVRVMADGRTVIENWTHHGPTRDSGEFEVRPSADGGASAPTRLVVEHFELDGYAVLELILEPVGR